MGESLLLALIGGALGCGAAYFFFKIVTVNASTVGPLANVHVSVGIVAETLALAAVLGIVSAFAPAYSANPA